MQRANEVIFITENDYDNNNEEFKKNLEGGQQQQEQVGNKKKRQREGGGGAIAAWEEREARLVQRSRIKQHVTKKDTKAKENRGFKFNICVQQTKASKAKAHFREGGPGSQTLTLLQSAKPSNTDRFRKRNVGKMRKSVESVGKYVSRFANATMSIAPRMRYFQFP